MPNHTVTTAGDPAAPGVLVLHPWWGVTPAVHWWADQMVSAGRRVVVPDLYGGLTVATEDEAEELAQATLSDPAAAAFVEQCADDLASDGVPWVAMGFSMGAYIACALTSRGDAGPADLILCYGGQPPPAGDVRTRHVDLHVAPADPWFDAEELAAVEGGFRYAGSEVTVHRYEGTGHWFAEVGSPGHDAAAASLARDRVLARLRVDQLY